MYSGPEGEGKGGLTDNPRAEGLCSLLGLQGQLVKGDVIRTEGVLPHPGSGSLHPIKRIKRGLQKPRSPSSRPRTIIEPTTPAFPSVVSYSTGQWGKRVSGDGSQDRSQKP